jgi:uncharacterized protein
MEPAIVYFELRVNDPQRQGAFYSSLFGWAFGPSDPLLGYRMIDTGAGAGAGLGGGMVPAQATLTPGITVSIQVTSLDASLERAQALGATRVLPPTSLPGGGRFAVMTDPEGNQLGLIES